MITKNYILFFVNIAFSFQFASTKEAIWSYKVAAEDRVEMRKTSLQILANDVEIVSSSSFLNHQNSQETFFTAKDLKFVAGMIFAYFKNAGDSEVFVKYNRNGSIALSTDKNWGNNSELFSAPKITFFSKTFVSFIFVCFCFLNVYLPIALESRDRDRARYRYSYQHMHPYESNSRANQFPTYFLAVLYFTSFLFWAEALWLRSLYVTYANKKAKLKAFKKLLANFKGFDNLFIKCHQEDFVEYLEAMVQYMESSNH